MAIPVVSGASLLCTMGLGPGTLVVSSQQKVLYSGIPAATIQDAAPMTNITPCGMCTSLANPTVASATAAALGVLTPMPCVPAPAGIWLSPGKTPLLSNIPGLANDGKLVCSYGGQISITVPGQAKVMY